MFYFFLEVCLKHSSADLLFRGGPPFFDKKIKVLLGDDLDLSLS